MKITFTVDGTAAFKVGDIFKPGNRPGRWQVTRAWLRGDGKPEYEATRIDINRKELRRRLAIERKGK